MCCLRDIRDELKDDVPEYGYREYNSFAKCEKCGKVYWEGSHKKIIDTVINGLINQNYR
jgi:uncharacterized protein with PIN domain